MLNDDLKASEDIRQWMNVFLWNRPLVLIGVPAGGGNAELVLENGRQVAKESGIDDHPEGILNHRCGAEIHLGDEGSGAIGIG